VQTFLPYADFAASARVLDDRRLGKQRVEVLQILRALYRETYGWKNHPAVLMWQGYEQALVCYGLVICREWCGRGKADTCAVKIVDELGIVLGSEIGADEVCSSAVLPPWLGDERLHAGHRAALLRKDPEWYGAHFTDDPEIEPYWPVRRQQP
jgi:hypothetical protein